jgi:succinate dehydrogenase/fumarate reductase-like Fe-S protein
MRLRVQRTDPGGGEPRWETYEVPEFPGMTVLDALTWVREEHDPSLAVRFSCRSANACKECLALVDGQRTYTCTAPAVGEVEVGPLPNRAVLHDLVTPL